MSNYFLGLRILDLLCREKIPIRVETAGLLLHIVNQDGVGGIWLEDKCIDMSELVSFTWNILLDQVVCIVVVENGMHFLGGVATDIWAKHDTAEQTIIVYQIRKFQQKSPSLSPKENDKMGILLSTCMGCHRRISFGQFHR